MCCCQKPNVNGTPGYSWDGKTAGIHQAHAPAALDGEEVLFDEPGRCGGIDAHAYHFRVVREKYGALSLLARHGMGDERILLSCGRILAVPLSSLDSNGRFWILSALYRAHATANSKATEEANAIWQKAAAEKRIKTRKMRGRDAVKVWIEEAAPVVR